MRLIGVLAAAVAATAITAWACARSPILADPVGTAVWRSAFVASYIAVGVWMWWRRPGSRLGPLVAGVGFLYSAASLNAAGAPLAYTLGMVVWVAAIVLLAYVYLCFPRGHLESRIERGFVFALVSSTAVVWGLILVLSPRLPPGGSFTDCGSRCPANALQIIEAHAGTAVALNAAFNVVFTVSLVGIAMLIFNKARSAASVSRPAMMPLMVVFIATIVEFVAFLFVGPAFPHTREVFKIADGALTLAVPFAMLAGQIRARAVAATTLGRVAVRASRDPLTPAALQTLIGSALGDPTLQVALWQSEDATYVDVDGAPVARPHENSGRAVTRVERNGWPVAALIHDRALSIESEIAEDLAAISLMLLENWRLVHELRASRSRLVTAAERERRRIERDLHDGAQQTLSAIQMRAEMAREAADPNALGRELNVIEREATAALRELRELAHGIYPQVLHDLGLAAALSDTARKCPLAVHISDTGVGRYPETVEAAIYFCAREAIQNACKHAGANASVAVTLAAHDHAIELTITDDGVGMTPDRSAAGVGMIDMRDRLEAVGGELNITSAPGEGTSIHASVPSRSDASSDKRSGEA